ncbi:MAG: hypothetical protein NTV68_01870 [Methanomicrobiales archaeon]|nr:hypothetical protein [Methanomicrobiales archaeon]
MATIEKGMLSVFRPCGNPVVFRTPICPDITTAGTVVLRNGKIRNLA